MTAPRSAGEEEGATPTRRPASWTPGSLLILLWILGVTFVFVLVNPPVWGSAVVQERMPLLHRLQNAAITAFHRPSRF